MLDERDEMMLERLKLRADIAQLLARDVVIEKALLDRKATARVFGCNIVLPTDVTAYQSGATLKAVMTALRGGREWIPFQCDPIMPGESPSNSLTAIGGTGLGETEAKEPLESRESSRVRDRVLKYLESVGSKGSKAALIRGHLRDVYAQTTHEKTVGMTLYRLLKEGLVRRDGHTWFLASQEAANPGAGTPGPINSTDRKE